ncbi:hypothetical protein DH20_14205 [Pantoea agglomerans]|nr:hypothetical protein [Pantoea agglomerans]
MTFTKNLLTLLFVSALPAAAFAATDKDVLPYPDDATRDFDTPIVKGGPANAAHNPALLDAANRLAAAGKWCRLIFSDLKRYEPLGAQKRDDLQNCLWVRYVSEQASQGTQALDRAQWEQKTQLDVRAADSQLIAAWQYPRTVKGPQ